MASKLTLISISSGFKGTDIETNFTDIADEFDDTLSRSGKSPNTMEAELDMNSNKIRNLAQAANNSDAATLKDVLDQTTEDATSKPATAITISDTGGYYNATGVEGALQELFDTYFTEITGAVTATHDELNKLDGVTATTAEINNADESATTGGGFMKGPVSSSNPSLAFDTWRTPNTNRPTWVQIGWRVVTDGTQDGSLDFRFDESGGTSADYTYKALVDAAWSSSTSNNRGVITFLVPAGGSYIVENTNDPSGANSISSHREFTL